MRRLFYIILLSVVLTGCGAIHPYRPDVTQGNVIDMTAVNKLKLGMSKAQVTNIMGTPVLQNLFNDNRYSYVYTFWPNHGDYVRKAVIVTFRNNRVVNIKKEL